MRHTQDGALRQHELQTLEQAARWLGVSVRTVRRYVAAGALTGYRLGPRLLRVDVAEVVGLPRAIPTARSTSRS